MLFKRASDQITSEYENISLQKRAKLPKNTMAVEDMCILNWCVIYIRFLNYLSFVGEVKKRDAAHLLRKSGMDLYRFL